MAVNRGEGMRAALRKADDVTARRKSARSTRHSARPALGNRPTNQAARPSARPALRSTRRPRATLQQWNTIVVSEPISVGATGSLYRLPAEVLPYAKHLASPSFPVRNHWWRAVQKCIVLRPFELRMITLMFRHAVLLTSRCVVSVLWKTMIRVK